MNRKAFLFAIFFAMIFPVVFFGCGVQTDIDQGDVSVKENEVGKVYTLDEQDAEALWDVVSEGDWEKTGEPNCAFDYTIYLNGEPVGYHTDCGTLYKADTEKSFSLESGDKAKLDSIIEKYIDKQHRHEPETGDNTGPSDSIGYTDDFAIEIIRSGSGSEVKTTVSGQEAIDTAMLLGKLKYDSDVCKCIPEYTVTTDSGVVYGVDLDSSYARCGVCQVQLTSAQVDMLREIFSKAFLESSPE